MKKKINKNFNKAEEEYRKRWFKKLWPETAKERRDRIENKSKRYTRPDYKHTKNGPQSKTQKESHYLINFNDAAKYLGVAGEQLKEMCLGIKGYIKLPYEYERDNHSVKFKLQTLKDYRVWLDKHKRESK